MNRIELAIKIARANPEKKWKLAAVGCRGGRVIAVGMNSFQQNDSPPGTIHYSCLGRHAETEMLRLASKPPRTVYVARVSKGGQPRLARPCTKCWIELYKAGVRHVVYTTNIGIAKEKLCERQLLEIKSRLELL